MSDNEIDISRRKLLGGLGVIGGAGAIGGSSTAALLWDEEVFGNSDNPNILQAGELDLKVDWEEHYVDWIGAETEYDVLMLDGDPVPPGYVGLPTPQDPLVAVPQEDIDAFMEATTVETSDEFDGPDDINASDENAPHDLVDQPDPVITLQDVKPGDFGEVTLSYHLFGNPGFVTVCADVLADEDNGITEPEDKVNGHEPDDSDGTEGGDLGDHLQSALWYDPDCNNRFDGGEVEVMLVTDASESMRSVHLPGTPDVNLADDDTDGDGNGPAMEAVKAAVGVGAEGPAGFDGLLDDVTESCGGSVEFGTVSAARDLHHLDNLDDGDDGGEPGQDDGALDAILDKGLHPTDELDEMSNLYGSGAGFSPDFETEDPLVNGVDNDGVNGPDLYEAERTYTEDGGSTVPIGVRRGHRALIPSDQDTSIPDGGGGFLSGIDPHGNAADPGEARKMIVVFTDGAFSAEGFDPLPFADEVSNRAAEDGIDIIPVITNPSPGSFDVEFAQRLATDGLTLFATHYDTDDAPASCPGSIEDAGEDCVAMTEAMQILESEICTSAGGEQLIASGTMNEVMETIGGFSEGCDTVLHPMAAGSSVSQEFPGDLCHEPSDTGCLALAYWLPRDIPGVNDNVVQTDRYEFTLSFNAVQCRHNTTEEGQPIDLNLGDADAEAVGD